MRYEPSPTVQEAQAPGAPPARATSMTLVCPITSTPSSFPLHFALPDSLDTHGCVACEQVRAYDLDARNATRIEKAPAGFVRKLVECLRSYY